MCKITEAINLRAQENYNRIQNMKTKEKFSQLHQGLNAAQLQAAYQLSEIDGFTVVGRIAKKDGLTLHLHENGNALVSPENALCS